MPPALTLPLHHLTPGQARGFAQWTGTGLALILLWGAWGRFEWPAWPLADSDSWGYLHPALSQFTGGGFAHTYGRNFVYPGWVWLLLRIGGDFRLLTVAQHLLGLGTGALLWTAWRQWRGWLPESRLPAWADALLGLGLTAFFTGSASQILYEAQIRPEAIFPFFAAGLVCLLFGFARAWFRDRRAGRAAVLAGLALFDAALLYQLKPSFGLAAGVAALPALWALVHPWRQAGPGRALLAGAMAAAGLAAAACFALPERQMARGDDLATLFLPETLLTIHAGPIRDQLAQDVRAGAVTPFPAAWLAEAGARLDREIRAASEPARNPYRSLGYYPDHLLYDPASFCAWLNAGRTPPEAAAFCFYYYGRAWRRRPGTMLAKVAGQLGLFYSLHCPAFWPANKLPVARYYRRSFEAMAYPNYRAQLQGWPPSAAWLAASEALQGSPQAPRMSHLLNRATVAAAVLHLPLLGLFLAGMAFLVWRREKHGELRAAGWLVLLVHGLTFGCCLTIAVVHSLEVDRYSLNLLALAVLAEAMEAAWLAEFGLRVAGCGLRDDQ